MKAKRETTVAAALEALDLDDVLVRHGPFHAQLGAEEEPPGDQHDRRCQYLSPVGVTRP